MATSSANRSSASAASAYCSASGDFNVEYRLPTCGIAERGSDIWTAVAFRYLDFATRRRLLRRRVAPWGIWLWEAVQSEFGICDCGGITLLEQACRACDRAERCRLLIDSEGEVIKSRGGALREHPLLRAELQNRAFITRTLARLGITDEPIKPMGRPPILGR
jgi:hypothetical protein